MARDDDQLQHFVKLFLGHRKVSVYDMNTLGRTIRASNLTPLAYSWDKADEGKEDDEGAAVFVSGIADENYWGKTDVPGQPKVTIPLYNEERLTEILDYVVAHELAHLIIEIDPSDPDFVGGEHTDGFWSGLMGESDVKNLDELEFLECEIKNINLSNRASIKP